MSRDDSGQVLVFALGLAVVVFAVSGLAVDGTRVFLMRRSLQSSADAAALAGASSIDTDTYYRSGGRRVVVDAARADATVARVIGKRGLPAVASIEVAGEGVVVTMRASTPTTFLKLLGIDEVPVAASGRATAFPQLVPNAP